MHAHTAAGCCGKSRKQGWTTDYEGQSEICAWKSLIAETSSCMLEANMVLDTRGFRTGMLTCFPCFGNLDALSSNADEQA